MNAEQVLLNIISLYVSNLIAGLGWCTAIVLVLKVVKGRGRTECLVEDVRRRVTSLDEEDGGRS